MKTQIQSANKSKGNGSRQPVSESDLPDPLSGKDTCLQRQMIAEAAYFRAEQRGFASGNEMSDWLQAEADMERLRGDSQ